MNKRDWPTLTLLAVFGILAVSDLRTAEPEPKPLRLHQAIAAERYVEAAQMMRIAIYDLNERDSEGNTPLCLAMGHKLESYDMASELLRLGADPNITCASGEPPLYRAALYGNLAVVDVLIRYGAETHWDEKDASKVPLAAAYLSTNPNVEQRLESLGARIPEAMSNKLGRMGLMRRMMENIGDPPDGMTDEQWEDVNRLKVLRATSDGLEDHTAIVDAMERYNREHPRPEGMSMADYRALRQQAALDEVYGANGQFNASDGSRR